MKKMYIDYEWGVEIPLFNEDGSALTRKDINNLKIDKCLKKMIYLWGFAIQNEMNWENPSDVKKYLPDYYYNFIKQIELDIIHRLNLYNIKIIYRS